MAPEGIIYIKLCDSGASYLEEMVSVQSLKEKQIEHAPYTVESDL